MRHLQADGPSGKADALKKPDSIHYGIPTRACLSDTSYKRQRRDYL